MRNDGLDYLRKEEEAKIKVKEIVAERDSLRAENDRLRGALEEIKKLSSIAGYDCGHSEIHKIASRALGKK